MRRVTLPLLVVLGGSPLYAAETSLEETLQEMEMRDVQLEQLDESLRDMTTSACVKTYEQQCADAFATAEESSAGVMQLESDDNP